MARYDISRLTSLCNNEFLIVGFLVVLAAALRIIHLNANPFWLDEGWTLYAALQPWVKVHLIDVHPPVFYWLVKLSISVFGISEVSVRLPAVIFGIIDIPLMYFFAKKYTGGMWPGVFATAFLTVSSVHLYFSQEARSYTLWLAVWLVFLILYLNALKSDPKFWDWGVVGISAGAMMWCHYWSMFPLAILFGYAIYRHRNKFLPGLLTFLITIFPLLPIFAKSLAIKTSEGWTLIYNSQNIVHETWFFFSGGNILISIIFLLLSALGLMIILESDRWKFEWTTILFFVSFLIAIVTVPFFMTLPKYFIYLMPFVYALSGLSLVSIGKGMGLVFVEGVEKWFIITLLILAVFASSIPLGPFYAEQNRGGWYDHDTDLTNITGGMPVAVLGNPGLVTLWNVYYHGKAEIFTNRKELNRVLVANTNGTYVFVPDYPVPKGMAEAEKIDLFLKENGSYVGLYRGFHGYLIPQRTYVQSLWSTDLPAYDFVYDGTNVTLVRRVGRTV